MTKQDQQDFKQLFLDVLKSIEGRQIIKEGTLDALKSKAGLEAIKDGTLEALKSSDGEEIIQDYLVDYFHDVLEPGLDDILHNIKQLKNEVKYMRDGYGMRIERLERRARLTI